MSIEVEDVIFTYAGNSRTTRSGLSMQIAEGETVLLLGPSGSGKSTLALCMCGLIPHAVVGDMKGRIRLAGIDTRETEPAELAEVIGTVFQDPDAQIIMMTMEDEVAFGLENMGVPAGEMSARIAEALHMVGLSLPRGTPIDQLSGGQKQRLALASVLAMKPAILLLDEPTANLDPVGTSQVFSTLRKLKRSVRPTIVLIEHKLDGLMDLVDRVVVLDHTGALVCSGSPRTLFNDKAAELHRLGVWFPQAIELTSALRNAGFPIAGRPLYLNELAEMVRHTLLARGDMEARETQSAPSKVRAGRPLLDIRPTACLSRKNGWLKPLSLQVHQGQFWAIVGENGAGKTTLARHIMGLIPTRPGTIYIDGSDATTLPASELARKIGYVFQNPEHQFVTERVKDEIAFGLKNLGWQAEDIAASVERHLARFGLTEYANSHPFGLSHGQKRRLSVAVMLAVGQDLLILDEPTFGQDQQHTAQLMNMLTALQREGKTILMITHDMTLVAEYADHVAVLSEGELLLSGTVDALFTDDKLLARAGLRRPPAAELIHLLSDLLPRRNKEGVRPFTTEDWAQRCMEALASCKEGEGVQ
ncbi:ABC transporter ATP-binding protein [Paenibacillus marchantiophytorum]|uniref:ABC transporter ATP-binding protein n=1 Tax=Paenibacillus marchantiophytorum TaxID=1619310 RepID=A0ABQ1FEL1_9BACL|nr:ABC transporter ATP-binding protein [Paenibacillus marchantiophytorum]GGA08284.1 ABC transporter ATP-binding protein [Paenibacillus marchantiophytorum]